MIEWNFNEKDFFASTLHAVTAGQYRVRIADAIEGVSRRGFDMITMTLDIAGFKRQLRYYIVFMPDKPDWTDRNLYNVWQAFGITVGDMNISHWIGKTGAAEVVDDIYNGRATVKIDRFLTPDEAGYLAPYNWETGEKPADINPDGYNPANKNDIPF